jgi:glycosyltransferase involved in cell wall biosynthesis
MPTYNRAAPLRAAFSSVLGQSYRNLEIIVSDNASTDETAAVCRTAASADSRMRVFRQAINIGPVANFEFVKNQATGKYFMWLADDDVVSEDYVAACVESLERNPEHVLVHGAATYLRADGASSDEASFSLEQESPIRRVLAYFWRVSENAMFYGIYRREAIARCQMPNLLGGDWGWIADIVVEGKTAVVPRAKIRRSAAGTSASYQRIMEVLETPRCMRRWPSLVLALGLGHYLAFTSRTFSARYPLARFLVAPVVTTILCYRLIVKPALGRWSAQFRPATRSGDERRRP